MWEETNTYDINKLLFLVAFLVLPLVKLTWSPGDSDGLHKEPHPVMRSWVHGVLPPMNRKLFVTSVSSINVFEEPFEWKA